MGASIGGKIVTDGLLLHYDALNKRSYPGSGTDWFNLASNPSYSGSFVNTTPTVTNGYASFTGENSTSRIVIGSAGGTIQEIDYLTPYVTVDMWVKIKTPVAPVGDTGATYLCGFVSYYAVHLRFSDDTFGFVGANQTNEVYGFSNFSALGLYNNWAHYCFVMVDTRRGPTVSNQKIYINGVPQTLSNQSGTVSQTYFADNVATTTFFGFPGRAAAGGDSVIMNTDIAIVKVYPRELTQAEVSQNFNAHKGRFNIY
jgi:hypothetical protein